MPDFPTHPLYQHHLHDWRRFRAAHEGGRTYIDLALTKHEHEKDKNFKRRVERAIYPNHIRSVIETYSAHLYRDAIARESGASGPVDELLREFWSDIDLLTTPADEFFEEVSQLVQQQGRAAIVCDRLDAEDAPSSRAQENELGVRPYCYTVAAEDLINWDLDRRGRLAWVTIRETPDQARSPTHEDSGEPVYQYRVWYPDRWDLWAEGEEGAVKIDSGEHPCGEVPVTLVFFGKRHGRQIVADSALKDLEPQNRRLVNLVSLMDEQIHQYVFSLLAVPQSTYDALETVNWSVSGAIPYHDDVSSPPHWIAPDVGQIAAIRAEANKTESTIRQLSGLGRVNEETKHVSTGIALSYLTFDKDALLAKFAERMRRAELQVARHAAAWMGHEVQTEQMILSYPNSFDPQDLRDSLDAALKVTSLGISGEALFEVQAFALRELLGSRISGDRLQELLATLKTADDLALQGA